MTLRFYTTEQLGNVQSVTPEGFLLCQNVPIARVGTMLYADGEVPIPADRDGLIRIHRDPEEVFSPMAMASFNGKPVTNDHPPEKVSPDNWRNYAIGTVLNPRRGDGLLFDNSFLYADLLITDTDAIGDIRQRRKREVSAGYDAEYEELRPGEGRQHLIVGNHVALVDKGRCGPSCFIGDEDMSKRRFSLRDALMNDFSRRVMDAYRSKDEATLVMELERVTGMLGDILSGASEDGGFANITAPENGYGGTKKATDTTTDEGGIHIHMHGGSGMDDDDVPPATPAATTATPDPAAAGGDDVDMGQGSLEDRVAALERAVAILARADEGGGAGADPDGDGDDDFGGGDDDGDDDDVTTDSDEDRDDKEAATTDRRARTGDKRRRATVGDSTSLKPAWAELLSRAELLAPGIKMPTFDAARSAKQTFDAMCNFRRKVIKEALKEDDTAAAIKSIGGKKITLDQMSCDAVTLLFNGASEKMRQANAPANHGGNGQGRPLSALTGGSMSDMIGKINARNLDFYSKPH